MATLGCHTRLEATYNYEAGKIKVEIEWGELKVNARATVESAICYEYEENKTRCRVYPYDFNVEPWINDKPNWKMLQILADKYSERFIQDESL